MIVQGTQERLKNFGGNQTPLEINRIGNVRKNGSLCYYEAAAKAAKNFDPYLWQHQWVIYVCVYMYILIKV